MAQLQKRRDNNDSYSTLLASPDTLITELRNLLKKDYSEISIEIENFCFHLYSSDIFKSQIGECENILLSDIQTKIDDGELYQSINSINILSKYLLFSDEIDKAKQLYNNYVELFITKNNKVALSLLRLQKGVFHFSIKELNEASSIFNSLIEDSLNTFNSSQLSELYYWMGATSLWTGEWDMSVNYLNACNKLSKKNDLLQLEVKCNLLLACITVYQNKLNDTGELLKFSYSNLDLESKEVIELNILSLYASLNFINSNYSPCLKYLKKCDVILKGKEYQNKFYLVYKLLSESLNKINSSKQSNEAQNVCITLLEQFSKVSKGKQALINFPEFNCFEEIINHAIQHTEYDSSPTTIHANDVKSLNILAIDDNKLNLFFTKKILSKQGYQTHIASSYNEVKRAIKSHELDIILMDIQMPRMNGYEMYQALLSEKLLNTSKTKVVAMTGYDSLKDKEKAFKLGMDDYLVKPFTPEQLNALVNKLIGERLLSESLLPKESDFKLSAYLLSKYGFSEIDLMKLLRLLSNHFKQASIQLKQGLHSMDCNKILEVSLDLMSNVQLIDHKDSEDLIFRINNQVIDKTSLSKSTELINQLINQLTNTYKKIESEINQFQ